MEYFGKIIAVSMEDLIRSDDGEAVISEGNYKKSVTRKRFKVLQRGCRGKKALIEYASLPEDIRIRFEAKYGDPEKTMKQEELSLPYDLDAQSFFNEYILPNGGHLPELKQQELENPRASDPLRQADLTPNNFSVLTL